MSILPVVQVRQLSMLLFCDRKGWLFPPHHATFRLPLIAKILVASWVNFVTFLNSLCGMHILAEKCSSILSEIAIKNWLSLQTLHDLNKILYLSITFFVFCFTFYMKVSIFSFIVCSCVYYFVEKLVDCIPSL